MSNFTIQQYKELQEKLEQVEEHLATKCNHLKSHREQVIDMLKALEIMEEELYEDEDSDEDVVLSGDIVDFHRMKNDTKQWVIRGPFVEKLEEVVKKTK